MFIIDYKFAPGGPGIQLCIACNEAQAQEFIKVLWDQAWNWTMFESSTTYLYALKNV